jgi:predicted Zn-dependent protease
MSQFVFSNFVNNCQLLITQLSEKVFPQLKNGEELSLNLEAEETFYIRFNQSQIRQNTQVAQLHLKMELQAQEKKSSYTLTMSGNPEEFLRTDLQKVLDTLDLMRTEQLSLDKDPYLSSLKSGTTSFQYHEGNANVRALIESGELMKILCEAAHPHLDMAGLWASGPQVLASAHSQGSHHFFATDNFFLDYSLFAGEKAVKGCYAGREFKATELAAHFKKSAESLEALKQPVIEIPKGTYRAYLAPHAMSEIMGLLGWEALSQGALQRGTSPFYKLSQAHSHLSSQITLKENFNLGLHPQFNSLGEFSSAEILLIQKGKIQQLLTSSRTAQEFKLESNQAEVGENPRSLEMMGGDLSEEEILKKLDTGFYLSNLHYLNWSDRVNARITGMTRYACLWVEKGVIKGPIKDMRFDVSLYDIWGEQLEALTQSRELCPLVGTYSKRDLGGFLLPGLLVKEFKMTL